MARHRESFHRIAAALLVVGLGACISRAESRDDPLPPLPPPAPEKAPEIKEKAPRTQPPTSLVPVELRISLADLRKQVLRTFMQKIDPKAEPVLPIVVKGNEKDFALGAAPAANDKGPVAGNEPPPPQPVPVMPAVRPQLFPRPPGARPRLDRLAARPLVAGVLGMLRGTADVAYRIEIRSLEMTVTGNTLICDVGAGFHCEAKPNNPPGVPPAAPVDVRDITLKLKIAKNLAWSETGKLELKEGTTQVWIDPEAPLVGFPRLDVERIVRLNGILSLMSGSLDRELMKHISASSLPDLSAIAPTLNQKIPLLAITELTAYPIRGDEKDLYFSFVVGLVSASKKTDELVKITTKSEPPPAPKLRGRILFDKEGKPEVKLDPAS
jgi:hypothetical protein